MLLLRHSPRYDPQSDVANNAWGFLADSFLRPGAANTGEEFKSKIVVGIGSLLAINHARAPTCRIGWMVHL